MRNKLLLSLTMIFFVTTFAMSMEEREVEGKKSKSIELNKQPKLGIPSEAIPREPPTLWSEEQAEIARLLLRSELLNNLDELCDLLPRITALTPEELREKSSILKARIVKNTE